ncbi:MAG: 23S rRNA (pseudouridine(1915)-N(3))-methyltransferase RlmH [Pyrinomonadaceae bacterium]
MRFRFVWVGKTRDRNWKALQGEYLKRLSRFVSCEVSETRDPAKGTTPETEGNQLLELLNPKSFVILLDVNGTSLTSQEMAKRVENWQNRSIKEISFIIGGSEGVAAREYIPIQK